MHLKQEKHNNSQPHSHQHVNHLSHPKYRPDIDGLRAVAVLSVLIFHAFPNALKGGFVGVDIFFVISGFLISSIIFGSLQRDTFSFAEFYSRRIRRIFPALIIVLTFCLVLGWLVLLPDTYKRLGKHATGGASFIANLMLIKESGYFDSAAETKPLLHLWSLGVEEQFYIVWPLLLWAAWKTRFNLFVTILSIMVASFALNIAKSHGDLVTDFYSPLTRFWELLAGALLAYCQLPKFKIHPAIKAGIERVNLSSSGSAIKQKLQDGTSILGALLLALSISSITRDSLFPGYLAAIPVLGAMLVIASGSQAWFNHTVLSSRILVWIGLLSYPLYLWHWPLLTFSRITAGGEASFGALAGALALAIGLAWLTYKVIEKPLRFGSYVKLKTIGLLLTMTVIGYLGHMIHKQEGMPLREVLTSQNEMVIELSKVTDVYAYSDIGTAWRSGTCFSVPKGVDLAKKIHDCVEPTRPLIFVWGDSYAAALYAGLLKYQKEKSRTFGIAQLTSSNAPPFFDREKRVTDWTKDNRTLSEVNEETLQAVSMVKPEIVLLAWKFDGTNAIKDKEKSLAGIESTVKKIKLVSPGSQVIVIGPVPQWKGSLREVVIQYGISHKGSLIPTYTSEGLTKEPAGWDQYFKVRLKEVGILYISAMDVLCNQDGCLTRTGKSPNDLTAVDYGHLTKSGSEYLIRNIGNEIFK